MTSCPSCSNPLPLSSISEQLGAARCPSCNLLIDLSSGKAVVPRRVATNVVAPEKWKIDAAPGSLTVRWRWFNYMAFILIPFTIFWNGILSTMAFGMTDGMTHPERLLIGIVVPHVWVGVGLVYYCLALFLNSTTVQVSGGLLTVRHAPLPWRGRRSLSTADVMQLFVLEKRGNKGTISYELCAAMRDGKRQSLVRGLNDELEARFLEVRLEQVMNIIDAPVEGEHRR